MNYRSCPLVEALCSPAAMCEASGVEWDVLVRQARAADMLGNLYGLLDEHRLLERIPAAPRRHLRSGHIVACKQARDVRWEVRSIGNTLRGIGVRMILLKGAAYVMADLPMATRRIFNDIDVLVPKDSIEAVELALLRNRWGHMTDNTYDDQYFRRWMHQIPPLIHLQRESVIDVHHTIVPETSRISVNRERLFTQAQAVPGHEGVAVLAPPHMVLHSASHLFDNGEFEHTLRDLCDIDTMLRHFGREASFWDRLVEETPALGLTADLHFALRYADQILGTPIPAAVVQATAAWAPRGPLAGFMDLLFERALPPDHPDAPSRSAALARWLLYIRSHYLRMPLHLLVPHLARKTVRRFKKEEE